MMAKLPPCRGCERDDCSCPICNRSGVAQHRGFTTPCHHCAGILTRSLREQLSAATARASELEKLLAERPCCCIDPAYCTLLQPEKEGKTDG